MTMDAQIAELFAAMEQAFEDYRRDIEAFERAKKPAEGLFGLGRRLQDDPCHSRMDERIADIVGRMAGLSLSAEDAERAVRMLISHDAAAWPPAVQWMQRAIERHALPLIPFLSAGAAQALFQEYAARYRRWERLPAQDQVYKSLKQRARS